MKDGFLQGTGSPQDDGRADKVGTYKEGYCPKVTEQTEQSGFGSGNQGQPRIWCLPDESVVMRNSEAQSRMSSQQGTSKISKVQSQAWAYLWCFSVKDQGKAPEILCSS